MGIMPGRTREGNAVDRFARAAAIANRVERRTHPLRNA